MYVKLIEPQLTRRPMDTDLKIRMSPPLGLYTIASLLRDHHRVEVQNESIEPITYDRPDVVGITITVNSLPRAIEIAQRFRQQGSLVVAGGIHATTAHQTIPSGCFDALSIGPAEGSWPQIVEDAKQGRLQPIYHCRPDFRATDIVSPAYDIIKEKDYLFCNIVHTSRGCPFKCDFCYNSGPYHAYLRRPIADVLADIEATHSRHIMFIDDNFVGNIPWTRQLLQAIKPLGIKWNAACSINVAQHPDLLDQMTEAGCRSLFIGFESINPSSIDSVHKVQNSATDYAHAAAEIHRRGIMINGSFVFGLDSDTTETFDATVDWIVENKIETVTSHILTPYPGTVTYDEMLRTGRLTTTDLALFDTAHVVFKPRNMTPEQLYNGYLSVYRKVYSWKNIMRRMPVDHSQRFPYLTFNLLYRKYGALSNAVCRCVGYHRFGRFAEIISRY